MLPPRNADELGGCTDGVELAQRIAAARAAKRAGFDAREPLALEESPYHAIAVGVGYGLSNFLAAEARFAELEAASNEPARNESGLWQRSDYGTEMVAYNPSWGYYDYWTEGERD